MFYVFAIATFLCCISRFSVVFIFGILKFGLGVILLFNFGSCVKVENVVPFVVYDRSLVFVYLEALFLG